MERQALLTNKLAEVDIHGSSTAVPTGKPLVLVALDIPQGVRDVLEVEVDSSFLEPAALAEPISGELSAQPLRRIMCVRSGERPFSRIL